MESGLGGWPKARDSPCWSTIPLVSKKGAARCSPQQSRCSPPGWPQPSTAEVRGAPPARRHLQPTEQEGASAESAFKNQMPPLLKQTPKCKAATWYSDVQDSSCVTVGPEDRSYPLSWEEPAHSTSLIVPSSDPGSSSHLGSRRVISLRIGTATLRLRNSLDHTWSWN